MKKNIKLLTNGLCSLTLALSIATTGLAATYSDVPSNHWANSAISKMGDLGFMVGDSSGKYSPNLIIDKFYASKVLAKAAGYKTSGYTASEKTYQDNAYAANTTTLSLFKKNFSKWDSSSEREIAYLLEKQILTVDDLNRFITVSNGVQTVRGLSKEDAALFLVRLMGKTEAALSVNPSTWSLFADDKDISAYNRPYIYYMKTQNMVSGDTTNKFNPKSNVTKAVFAAMLNNAYASISSSTTAQNVNKVESTSGTILEVYSGTGALQVKDFKGETRLHNVALGTQIKVDGFVKTLADIKSGMSYDAVLVNNELTNISATTASSVTTTVPEAASQAPVTLQTLEGTVSHVGADAVAMTISIDVRMLNTVGAIYTETRTFKLSSDCKISRGMEAITLSSIVNGDIVSAQVSGNSVYKIDVRQAQMNFSGTLTEKKVNNLTNYYVITDNSGNSHELVVDGETVIERAPDESGLKWNDLKRGDRVEVKTNYNVITYIKGEGVRTNIEGQVKEIHIYENNLASIVFHNSQTGATKEYPLSSSIVDIYSIRVGDKLRLRLDSEEIDSFTKLANASVLNVTGKVSAVKSNYFTLTPVNSSATMQIYFDNNTYVYDTISRKSSSPSNLMQNMELFVTYQPGAENYASTITILSR